MKIDFKGNRWYKCDFHLHTPASLCFKDKSVTPAQFIDKVVEQELDCIAITDHNAVTWIDCIREEGNKRGIIVFPGVEITCSDSKIHILVIFDRQATVVEIEDFMRDAGIKRDDFGQQTAQSTKSIIDIAKIANEAGAIAIPAHIDSYSGLSNASYQIQKEFLNIKTISAVQMVNKDLILKDKEELCKDELYAKLSKLDANLSRGIVGDYIECSKLVKNNEIGILTFSDNPDSEDSTEHGLWGIGKEFSWIKMDETPSLESLRQAMMFPDIRIKTCFEASDINVKRFPDLWIKNIKVKDIETLGSIPLEVEFNPQLTTIIGGRGSGKSTIVRLLTGLFSSNVEPLSEIYEEFLNFFKIKGTGKLKYTGVLKSTTEIYITIIRNDILYEICAKNFRRENDFDINIKKFNQDEEKFINIEENIEDLFRVDIYNQKQVYTLAQNTNALRDKLDSMIYELPELKKESINIASRYKLQNAKIRDIKISLQSMKKVKSELNDICEKIEVYRKSGINDILAKYESFNKQNRVIQDIYLDLNSKIKLITDFKDNFEKSYMKVDFTSEFDAIYEKEITSIINYKNEDISKMQRSLDDTINSLKIAMAEFTQKIKQTKWFMDYFFVKENYENQMEILKSKGLNLGEINSLLKLKDIKEKELKDLIQKESLLKEEYEILEDIRIDYIKIREQISNQRGRFANELLKDTNIKIKIKKFRDYDNFISKFREIIQKPSGFTDEINSIAIECFNGEIKNKLESFRKKILDVKYKNENLFGGKINRVINMLNDEQVAELQLLLPEDDIHIEYKPNNSSEFKSLKNASAGQRTSAILTFILADGNVPLVLDQPEDDLDNHLIYDLVVERIKQCKQKRQIIVITHNANIPVNGDAELIIAMDSNSKNVNVFRAGTIEEKILRDEICNVMEGGEKAFMMRASRYSLY